MPIDSDVADDPAAPEGFTQHLYLVRHGQTALNAEGRLRGLANPPLDAKGEAEVGRLAAALATRGIATVVSSPLDRAAHTARIIAATAGVTSVTDDRFNDRDYGRWTGELLTEVLAQWGTLDDAPGVEPVAHVLARARPALDALLDDALRGAHPEAPVVVVTHDALIRPLIVGIDPTKTGLATPTASWNDLVRTRGVWSVGLTDQKPAQ